MAKILAVDDQETIQQVIRDLLEMTGHEVLVAGHGQEALDILENHRVDIITVDLLMPGMNGIELIRRQREAFPDVKAMIISGAKDLLSCLPPEFDGVPQISKPFSPDELCDAVAKLLQ